MNTIAKLLFTISLGFLGTASGALLTFNFDGVAELTSATNLYSVQGVTFSSGDVYVSGAFGGSLNEQEFPPRSAEGVFLNDFNFSSTRISFATAINSFQSFLTYGGPITINFYNSSDTLVNSILSAFNTNVALSGETGSVPNEEFTANSLVDVTYAEILSSGADFTLDDLTINTVDSTEPPTTVPEPSSIALLAGSFAYIIYRQKRSSR